MRAAALLGAGVLLGIVLCVVAIWGTFYYMAPREAGLSDSFIPNSDEQFAKARARYDRATNEYERWCVLDGVAFWSVDVGALDQAEAHARALLAQADQHKGDWNYGNAIHKANLTLGRVALRRGDRSAAQTYLIAAGKTPGSPQLNSFGPNMLLAKELLEVGEKAVVLEYFKLCSSFWQLDGGRLRAWAELVEKDQHPNFGANLLY